MITYKSLVQVGTKSKLCDITLISFQNWPIWSMGLHLHTKPQLVAIASCLGQRKVRHSSMSVLSRKRKVPTAVVIVTQIILRWVIAMWQLRMNGFALGCYDSIILKVSYMCTSTSHNCLMILSDGWKISLVCRSVLWQSRRFNHASMPYQSVILCLAPASQNMCTCSCEQCSYSTASWCNFQKDRP